MHRIDLHCCNWRPPRCCFYPEQFDGTHPTAAPPCVPLCHQVLVKIALPHHHTQHRAVKSAVPNREILLWRRRNVALPHVTPWRICVRPRRLFHLASALGCDGRSIRVFHGAFNRSGQRPAVEASKSSALSHAWPAGYQATQKPRWILCNAKSLGTAKRRSDIPD